MMNKLILLLMSLCLIGCSANKALRTGYIGFVHGDLEITYEDSINQEGVSLPVIGNGNVPISGVVIPVEFSGNQGANRSFSNLYVEEIGGDVKIRIINSGNLRAKTIE